MGERYRLRAALEFGRAPVLDVVPIKLGPFLIHRSPNGWPWQLDEEELRAGAALVKAGYEWQEELHSWNEASDVETDEFPSSAYYIEAEYEVENRSDRFVKGDALLMDLEAVLKLFRPGFLYIRRHSLQWHTVTRSWIPDVLPPREGEETLETLAAEFLARRNLRHVQLHSFVEEFQEKEREARQKTAKAPEGADWTKNVEEPLVREFCRFHGWDHERELRECSVRPLPPFPVSKWVNWPTAQLLEFFSRYWDTVQGRPPPLDIAVRRFCDSYERSENPDRLIDLMVAMEAMFGKTNSDLTYKLSLRAASFIYGPNEARKRAFDTIKRLYNERSQIVHGKTAKVKGDIADFEDYVRLCIVKMADLFLLGISFGPGEQGEEKIDDYLFFTPQQPANAGD